MILPRHFLSLFNDRLADCCGSEYKHSSSVQAKCTNADPAVQTKTWLASEVGVGLLLPIPSLSFISPHSFILKVTVNSQLNSAQPIPNSFRYRLPVEFEDNVSRLASVGSELPPRPLFGCIALEILVSQLGLDCCLPSCPYLSHDSRRLSLSVAFYHHS
jgi:hypothetical protein